MIEDREKNASLLKLGCSLIVASYLLYVPILLFTGMAVGGHAWLWGRCAVAIYALSWALFISGLLVAGRDALRLSRQWIGRMFKRQPTLSAQPNNGTVTEETPATGDKSTVNTEE